MADRFAPSETRVALTELISQGCEAFYRELWGDAFWDALAPHHIEALEWHWEARLAFLEGRRPQYLAYFPIWSRGHQKTSLAEKMVVTDGMLSLAFDQPGFCLFIGREKDKVKENISNIEALLSSHKVREYAPELSEVARNDETNQKRQWTGTFLHTRAKYIVKGGSIESTQAGSRIEQTRPTWQVFDDIDGREDSPTIAETRFKRLTGEIIPMRQGNTLHFFAQNLISKFSVMYKIQTQQVQVLTNRKPTQPIPAVTDLITDQRTDEGGMIRDFYVSGESTWKVWDEQRIQDEIDSEGLDAFKRECQHDLGSDAEGRVHKAYNDEVHAISYSQFASVFGSRDAWKDWFKIVFNDWARTKTKYHANVGGYIAVSNANTVPGYEGFSFLIPMSFEKDAQPADAAVRFLSVLTPYAYQTTTWSDLVDQAWKRTNAHQHFQTVGERAEYEKNYYEKIIPKYSRPVLRAYKVRSSVMSHSEDKVREMYNDGFGFAFEPANPGKHEGIEDINAAMRVDYEAEHKFKLGVKGYTRWYVLCPDDLTQEPAIVRGTEVYPPCPFPEAVKPDELHDSTLFRYQMVKRRHRPAKLIESGEIIDELEKTNDDFGQGLQMAYAKGLLSNLKLSPDELQELTLAPQFRMEAIKQAEDAGATGDEVSRMLTTRTAHLALPKVLKHQGKSAPSRFARFKR